MPSFSLGRLSIDGFSFEGVAQFNLEWIFSKLDSGFLVLDSGFHKQKIPGFRNPDSLTRGDSSARSRSSAGSRSSVGKDKYSRSRIEKQSKVSEQNYPCNCASTSAGIASSTTLSHAKVVTAA